MPTQTIQKAHSILHGLQESLQALLPSKCQLQGGGCAGWATRGVLCEACSRRYGHRKSAEVLRCIQCAQVLNIAGESVRLQIKDDENGATVRLNKQWRCGHCIRLRPALRSCHAAVSYTGVWIQAVAQFKPKQAAKGEAPVSGNPALARLAAQVMLESADIRDTLEQAQIVLPIPSHPQRLKKRGFEPASTIAYALRKQSRCAAPVAHALRMHKQVQDQRRLNRTERFANMQGAFDLSATAEQCRGKHVVLVDDVITTGATLFAAAEVLQALKPASVRAVVWARTPL